MSRSQTPRRGARTKRPDSRGRPSSGSPGGRRGDPRREARALALSKELADVQIGGACQAAEGAHDRPEGRRSSCKDRETGAAQDLSGPVAEVEEESVRAEIAAARLLGREFGGQRDG